MSEPTHFDRVADYVMSNDGSELSMVKAERDYALHCLEREIALAHQAQERIEALEAALRERDEKLVIYHAFLSEAFPNGAKLNFSVDALEKARAALAPETGE